ncbi:M20/M25/M40 family metallo-hydrolase [Aliikangiella marina]|uniref:M20/M25/M40 family metallo-hydrolase n=1 Tax=Aliikangiella marina TaxID=1712262 RepID=A0A545TH87_9GAMM|nr:M20/M25/M40 family metallo-hydrolase [Aliikangiella marina]TQV76546.1 M20/M25/M40 family metallo-hydrolase [Aliikangiella marina]
MQKLILAFALAIIVIPNTLASALNFEQVSKDVHFLADDKLMGRATYTKQIDIAADYIANRFQSIGLQPLDEKKGFKQSFEIFGITVDSVKLQLNGASVSAKSLIALTSHQKLNWNSDSTFETVMIDKQQDFRKAMTAVNQKQSDVLVLIDPSHQAMFARYQSFFSRQQSKFNINQGPSALLVLTDTKKVESLNLSLTTKVETKKLANVVGVLPGKSHNEEYVLFSAHYDHVGTKLDLQGDKIFNGADDNASGTTAVINLAQYYAAKRSNERTLIFVAFTAEEIGGFGSKYFAKQVAPEKIKAMINIEMIGKPSKFGEGQLWMTGYERSNLAELLNQSYGSEKIKADPYPDENLFYRSDNATLAKLGVPAHSFSSSQIDIDKHYHQVTDEVDTLDLNSMFQVIQTLAKASQGLVDGSLTPTRVDTSQVRPNGSFY